MRKKRNIYIELSEKYGIHRSIIEVICNSPFVFAAKAISNDSDEKTIMLPYFGKIKLRKKYTGIKAQVEMNREPWFLKRKVNNEDKSKEIEREGSNAN